MIPGIGTWVGGAVNAGVASLITSALGFAISEICYNSCKKIARGEKVDAASMFNAEEIQRFVREYTATHKKNGGNHRKLDAASMFDTEEIQKYAREYTAVHKKNGENHWKYSRTDKKSNR